MPDSDQTKKWFLKGAVYQLPMIFIFLLRAIHAMNAELELSWESLFESHFSDFSDGIGVGEFLMNAGLLLMALCMLRIYRPRSKKSERTLIMSDVFAITRHPMYHGMYIADLGLFFFADLSDPVFWVSWVLFTILIFTAGWHQEKETLARWGKEAERYYRRTPRFAFEWLWFWARRPQV